MPITPRPTSHYAARSRELSAFLQEKCADTFLILECSFYSSLLIIRATEKTMIPSQSALARDEGGREYNTARDHTSDSSDRPQLIAADLATEQKTRENPKRSACITAMMIY